MWTFSRSPVFTSKFCASLGLSHSGFRFEISYSHLALALRVWIWEGRRKVGTRQNSLFERSHRSGWTWLFWYVGIADSGYSRVLNNVVWDNTSIGIRVRGGHDLAADDGVFFEHRRAQAAPQG